MAESEFEKKARVRISFKTLVVGIILFITIPSFTFCVFYWYKFRRFPWQEEVEEIKTEVLSVESAVNSIIEEDNAVATTSMSVEVIEDADYGVIREVSVLGTIESVDSDSGSMIIVPSSSDDSLAEHKIQVDLSDDTEVYIRDLTEISGVQVVPGGFITDGENSPPPLEKDDKIGTDQLSEGDLVMVDITLNEANEAHAEKIEVIKQ